MSKDEWRMKERDRQDQEQLPIGLPSTCTGAVDSSWCAQNLLHDWWLAVIGWSLSVCLSALSHSLPRIHWRRFRSRSQNRHNMTQHQRLLLLYPSTSAALFIPNYSLDTALVSHKPSQRKNLRQENQISSPFSFFISALPCFGSRPTEFLKKYGFRRLWIRLFRRRWLPHWRWHVLGCHWG